MSDDKPTCGWGVNDSIPMYNGDLSYVKAFDHVLTAEEISAIWTAHHKPWYKRLWRWLKKTFRRRTLRERILRMKPLAFWPLDERSGEVVKDISGNGNDGALEELISDNGSEWGLVFKIGGKANE